MPNAADTAMPSPLAEQVSSLGATGIDVAATAGTLLAVLDRLDVAVSLIDAASGRYLHANARMEALLGLETADPTQVLGPASTDSRTLAASVSVLAAEQLALASATPTLSEHGIERDGRRREFSVLRAALPQADGAPARYLLSVWTEVTVANEREAQLQQALMQIEQQQIAAEAMRRENFDQSPRDGATGLYRKLHFDDQLRREVDLSSREHREFALVSIAFDPFSDDTQALGAPARHRVLEALGLLLRGNTRAMDASCRLDEDSFAVLLSGVGLAMAHARMEGLRRQCATQIVVMGGRNLGFTVSMGVASFPHTAHTDEELMAASNAALREAQARGGNRVALASIRFELGST